MKILALLAQKGGTGKTTLAIQRVAFSHALIDGRAVNEYDPNGKAAAEIARLWRHISTQLGLASTAE